MAKKKKDNQQKPLIQKDGSPPKGYSSGKRQPVTYIPLEKQ